jgi:D-glycero-alpha-D-manno-heptose-7-phosphate kinase
MLFFTGTARDSAKILREQQQSSAQRGSRTLEGLHRIKGAAIACRTCLEAGDLDSVGALLDEGWREKRRLASGITNLAIDRAYGVARSCGAISGKITGAGGGGFLLLYCDESRQEEVTDALEELGLRRMDFHFDQAGVSLAEVAWEGERARPSLVGAASRGEQGNGTAALR